MRRHSFSLDPFKVLLVSIFSAGFMICSCVQDTELHPNLDLIDGNQIDHENAILTQKQQVLDFCSELQILYDLQLQNSKDGLSPAIENLKNKDLLITVE